MTIQTAATTIINILTKGKSEMKWTDYCTLKRELKEQPSALAKKLTDEQLDEVVSELPAELLNAVQQAAMSDRHQCLSGSLLVDADEDSIALIASVLATPIKLVLIEWVARVYRLKVNDITLSCEVLKTSAPKSLEVMRKHSLLQTQGEDIGDETLSELIKAVAQDLPSACALLRKAALRFENPYYVPLAALLSEVPDENTVLLGRNTTVAVQETIRCEVTQQQLSIVLSSPLMSYILLFLQKQERLIKYTAVTVEHGMLLASVEADPLAALGIKPEVVQG